MSSTTTQDAAWTFRKKPVAFEPAAWSGRLNVAEMSRPGGLLTAALMQCAAERDLSLSELATALGVNYWTLSQLRIGFRTIESLDQDVIDGCSALLDLPALTIQALAGLVSPADMLTSADLTAEDLLHARQLASTEPDSLILLPPPNRARPLQGMTIDELVELHREHASHPVVVEMLRAELGLRPRSKTEQLRAAIAPETIATPEPDDAPRASAAAASGILSCAHCQKRLRIPHLPEPGEIRCPSCSTEYSVHWQGMVCLVQALDDLASSADEDDQDHAEAANGPFTEPQNPWSVLGLAPNSPWDQVERARRSLLQQYHPDRLGHVSPLVRQLAEAAFKRVNTAFETVRAQRH
jgi:RNA polymerase subunit RPABC4/transcription elongation factor Spt4